MLIEMTPRPGRVLRLLLLSIALLTLAHFLNLYSKYFLGNAIGLFDLGVEGNLPTFFSALLLLGSSVLLFTIAQGERGRSSAYYRHWLGLGVVFLFLAFDEASGLHEVIGATMGKVFDTKSSFSGVFYYGWSLLYLVAALIVAVAYLRFLWSLPRNVARMFVLSGGMFVLGAVGIEMIVGARYQALPGLKEAGFSMELLKFDLIETSEELLEMVGVTLFIHTLSNYLFDSFDEVRLRLER